jgi:outer membrane protein assembly factor BamB
MLVGAQLAIAQDWPQWRGPGRNAKVADFKAPAVWPKELKQQWKVTVGDGVSTPSLVGERLYVFAMQDKNEVLRCLEAATGKEIWQAKYEAQPATGPASGFGGPRASPTVADGKVVTLGVRGVVSCYDATSGKQLWRKDDFKGSWPSFFTSSSPLVVDGLCIAQLGGQRDGAIVAYDLATGEMKWRFTGDGTAYASPSLLLVGEKRAIVAETDKNVVAIDLGSGKVLWKTPFAVEGRGYNAASPIVEGEVVIYTGSGRGVRAARIANEGDALAAKELWNNKDKSMQYNTPVVKDGLLYGLTEGNELFCIDLKDGKTAWSVAVGQASGGAKAKTSKKGRGGGRGGYGSIVDAGSVLLALTPSSQLIVFKPSDKEFVELARIKVADTPTYAYPVISGSRLFIKDEDSVTLWTFE